MTTYKTCSRCVLDTTTNLIQFDEKGVCNFCYQYDNIVKNTIAISSESRAKSFDEQIAKIKLEGVNQKYDCLVGVSGGLDSTYVAYLAKVNSLRALLVHFDNGWNSNLATSNIENIVKNTGFDLYTHVIGWEQFKDLQKAYFRSSVVDIEVPTDQLIYASLFKIAKNFKVKNILSGENLFTETVMPLDWAFEHKLDYTNLKNIHKKYGEKSLKDFPRLGVKERAKYERENFKLYRLINFTNFDYNQIIVLLSKELGWVNHEAKHFESIFTRFYQGYILPNKFGIDKRKAHFSNLINSKFMSRDEAIEELKKPTYDLQQQQEDLEYVLKKWDMNKSEFDEVMKKPKVSHDVFGYDKKSLYNKFENWVYFFYLYKFAYPLGIIKRPNTNQQKESGEE